MSVRYTTFSDCYIAYYSSSSSSAATTYSDIIRSHEKYIQLDCVIATVFVTKEQWEGTINDTWGEGDEEKYWLTESTPTRIPLNQSLVRYLYPKSSTYLTTLTTPTIIIVLLSISLLLIIGAFILFAFVCCHRSRKWQKIYHNSHNSTPSDTNANSEHDTEMQDSLLLPKERSFEDAGNGEHHIHSDMISTQDDVSIITSIPTFNGNASGDFFNQDTLNPQIEYI